MRSLASLTIGLKISLVAPITFWKHISLQTCGRYNLNIRVMNLRKLLKDKVTNLKVWTLTLKCFYFSKLYYKNKNYSCQQTQGNSWDNWHNFHTIRIQSSHYHDKINKIIAIFYTTKQLLKYFYNFCHLLPINIDLGDIHLGLFSILLVLLLCPNTSKNLNYICHTINQTMWNKHFTHSWTLKT